jgi:peptidoglycan hydrolase FlgJ
MDAVAAQGRSLDALRAGAARDPKAAVKEAARQFETLFMNELMKSMRASVGTGALDNSASEMGTQMLDAQYAAKLSGLPGGLADMIARQLERQIGATVGVSTASAAVPQLTHPTIKPATEPRIPQRAYAEDFVRRHSAAAQAAERETGIPAAFILAQAAHETGWGRKQITNADGTPSHNLFGIKAGGAWQGKTTEITTTEYIDGRARKVKDGFRAYANVEESFVDWARLIKNSPRYAGVVQGGADAQAFAQGLQRAGYATDPAYGDKLERMINTTLRLQRAAG